MPEWKDNAASVLAKVPGFQSARVESLLTDGLSHQSVLVDSGCEIYVLRIDKPTVHALGLDRAREYRLASIVAAAGLCPPWFEWHVETGSGADPGGEFGFGWAVRRWWPGQSLERRDLDEVEQLSGVGRLLQKLHGLEASAAGPDDCQDRLEPLLDYAGEVATREAEALRDEGSSALEALSDFKPLEAICHNDLVCQNVVCRSAGVDGNGSGIYLIDLEYAALGDPFFDLATVIEHHELESVQADCLLESYLGTVPNGEQSERLGYWRQYYGSLLKLWKLRVARETRSRSNN